MGAADGQPRAGQLAAAVLSVSCFAGSARDSGEAGQLEAAAATASLGGGGGGGHCIVT